jgi:hypothetical protein
VSKGVFRRPPTDGTHRAEVPLEDIFTRSAMRELAGRMRARMRQYQEGKIGYILLWLIGVPVPILFLIYLLRSCT